MATPHYGQAADTTNALKAEIKSLTVERLKNILRTENLTVSGVKSELQIRLIAYIEKAQFSGDRARIDRIRGRVRGDYSPYVGANHYQSPQSSASPQNFYSSNSKPHSHAPPYNMAPNRTPFGSNRPNFVNSPFYSIDRSLSEMVECKARETTRDTAKINLILPLEVTQRLSSDENCRVMVFCGAENLTHSLKSDISFPHQVELKCNDQEVKGNLRGLKNKPGSTRPADITTLLKKKTPNQNNAVEMVYALTTKKFYLVINLVQKKPVTSLVEDLRRKSISKEQVLREMASKASDPDIVATSSVMSLKCPISFTRIRSPCRGMGCIHNQCFDATSYLQLQEQGPTWTCPVCNKSAGWDNLVIDNYVQEILDKTSKDTDQVTIEPNGDWSRQVVTQTSGTTRNNNPTPSDDDDDDDEDLVIVSRGSAQAATKNPFQALTPSSVRTPPLNSSREASTVASIAASRTSNKRPRDEVIDLTLSDDDDIQPRVKPRIDSSSNLTSFPLRPPEGYHPTFSPAPPPPSFNYEPRYNHHESSSPTSY